MSSEQRDTMREDEQRIFLAFCEFVRQFKQGMQQAERTVSTPANYHIMGVPWARAPRPPEPEIYGRVRLVNPDEDGRVEFYIGSTHMAPDDHRNEVGCEVISTGGAAGYERAFFRPADTDLPCGPVEIVRSIDMEGGRVVDFEDQWVTHPSSVLPWQRYGKELRIKGPRARDAAPKSQGDVDAQMQTAVARTLAEDGLRAGSAVLRALSKPRTERLHSALRTLQPDQYELISRPISESMLVQGGPGSGKTIIAVHRAGLLAEAGGRTGTAVLLLGPTDVYRQNVEPLLAELIAGKEGSYAAVTSIAEFVDRTLQLNNARPSAILEVIRDIDVSHRVSGDFRSMIKAAMVVTRSAAKLVSGIPVFDIAIDVYRCLREMFGYKAILTIDDESRSLLQALPALPQWQATYFGRLTMAIILASLSDTKENVHLIIDEAQDLRPLEWLLIQLRAQQSPMTLVGDFNQRGRTTFPRDWDELRELFNRPEELREPIVLTRTYRSNAPIIELANRLLPPQERVFVAIQPTDKHPKWIKVANADLLLTSLGDEIVRLNLQYPEGTVAVVAVDSQPLRQALLRRKEENWSKGAQRLGVPVWQSRANDGMEVRFLTPHESRGLEFDAVIVVEPAQFAELDDDWRSLYVALTRANQELVIVHKAGLPKQLRPASVSR